MREVSGVDSTALPKFETSPDLILRA
jgi:hypothetical protein